MTTKDDYSPEEWNLLLTAPTNAAVYVMTADMSVMGAFREMKAFGKELEDSHPPAGAQELVTALITDIHEKSKNKEKIEAPQSEEGEDPREPARRGLQQVGQLLDEKCAPEEAVGFKQWLLAVAQAVAEADKEGSHFGLGGVRVSDKEKAAIAEIQSLVAL